MLTVHHLGRGQSERVIWLCEELGLDYRLVRYDRDPKTILAPPELKALHPSGAAPLISDGGPILAESGAIVEYILAKYGAGRLAVPVDAPGFADYLHWLHFANGTLQPAIGRAMLARRAQLPADHPVSVWAEGRRERALGSVEEAAREHALSGGQCVHRSRYHDGVFAHHHAAVRAVRPCALSRDPRLFAAHRRPRGLPARHGEGRSRCSDGRKVWHGASRRALDTVSYTALI